MKIVAAGANHTDHVDRFGAIASSLCAVHCAVCALMPAAFGALGLGALLGHEAEWGFTLVAVAFGALVLGWRRHRSALVVGMLGLGIVGLLTSRGLEMGSGHHDHHDEGHHAESDRADSHALGHHDHHAGADPHGAAVAHESSTLTAARVADHDEVHDDVHADQDEGALHTVGASVGILAGLFLLFGHLLNIRTARRCRAERCK